MQELIAKLIDEWKVISGAKISFITCILILGGVIWAAFNWSYGSRLASKDEQLANKDSQIALLIRQRDDYRDKLGGASPDQAAQKIAALEKRIEELTINRWPPLTADEMSALVAQLREMTPQHVNVLCSLAACDDLAESFTRAIAIVKWKGVRHSAYFTDGINVGIEIWFVDDVAQKIANAIERATNNRLKITPHKRDATGRPFDEEINLVIGRKL